MCMTISHLGAIARSQHAKTLLVLTYQEKFLQGPIFTLFALDWQTAKTKLAK